MLSLSVLKHWWDVLRNIWREEWVETVRRDSEDTKYRGQRERMQMR